MKTPAVSHSEEPIRSGFEGVKIEFISGHWWLTWACGEVLCSIDEEIAQDLIAALVECWLYPSDPPLKVAVRGSSLTLLPLNASEWQLMDAGNILLILNLTGCAMLSFALQRFLARCAEEDTI